MTENVRATARELVHSSLVELRPAIIALSHDISDNPELAYEEVHAAQWLLDAVAGIPGIRTRHGIGPVETAFTAETGTGGFTVTLCAEYDALPDIGHGCGHNIIASASLGAFLALSRMTETLDITVRLIGTPAEERGGGKVDLLREGAFDGSDIVMMIHPAAGETGFVISPVRASYAYRVTFTGRAAHAAAEPWRGANAMDALTIASTALGLARQQFEPGQQAHGYIVSAGAVPNVIAETAVAEWMIRAYDVDSMARLAAVFTRCIEAGAHAAGTTVAIEPYEHPYTALTADEHLAATFYRNTVELGIPFEYSRDDPRGSTDMANVTNFFPGIHPMLTLGAASPPTHTAAFAEYARGPHGDQAASEGALLLALTAVDVVTDPELRALYLERERPYTRDSGSELGVVVKPYLIAKGKHG